MGAETRIYVQCMVTHIEWREVSAVTLDEARQKAATLPGVTYAIRATYDEPDESADGDNGG